MSRFQLVKTDDTQYWQKEFLEENRIKRIFSHALVDTESRTYCCEATPSYYLDCVGFSWESMDKYNDTFDDVDDTLHGEFHSGREPGDYMHCFDVDSMPIIDWGALPTEEQCNGRILIEEAESMEDALESVNTMGA